MGRETVRGVLWRILEETAPAPGDRLPPERSLKTLVGCSRETLRAVLATLEAEGQIWRHVGQGTFRGPAPSGQPIRDTLLNEAVTPQDLMDARRLLEPQVAAAAAMRHGPGDIAFLHARVEAGRRARDRAAGEAADDAFHQAVAQVARNPVLIALLRYLSGARRRATWQREWDRIYRRIGVSEFTGLHSAQHQQIVDAIALGDHDGARLAMDRHLASIDAAMQAQVSSVTTS